MTERNSEGVTVPPEYCSAHRHRKSDKRRRFTAITDGRLFVSPVVLKAIWAYYHTCGITSMVYRSSASYLASVSI